MDAKTAEALEASIAKWKRNAEEEDPTKVRIGSLQCPLCLLYCVGQNWKSACFGCPVADKAGVRGCAATPYDRADLALDEWLVTREPATKSAFRAAALAEVAFLESLREPVAVEDAA